MQHLVRLNLALAESLFADNSLFGLNPRLILAQMAPLNYLIINIGYLLSSFNILLAKFD